MQKRFALLAAAAASLTASAGHADDATAPAKARPSAPSLPRRIPTSELAQDSLLESPRLSPDGGRILTRVSIGGKTCLAVHSLHGDKRILIGIPDDNDLRWYRWAGDNRILISLGKTVPYFNDDGYATRLLRYDLKDNSFLQLGAKTEGLEGDDLLYTDPGGGWILLSFQKTPFDYPSVSRVELADNKISKVVSERDDVWEWYADEDGIVRVGVGTDRTGWSMVYRRGATDKFRKLPKVKWDDEDGALDIMGFIAGSDEGYVLSNKQTGRYALYKFNYATKQLGDVVLQNDTNDINGFSTSKDGKALRSAWFTDDRDRIVWFDDKMKQFQSEIDGAVKTRENWILSMSRDDSSMLVWTGASNDPGAIYDYIPAAGRMFRVAKINEKLHADELSETRYVSYKARDGLEIHGYLTLPRGRDPKNLPLIVHPHGGPYDVRDNQDFDPEVQFLANRGYAVLQPNFRGSSSYGKAFYEKGESQWGRQMQDDLDDGMDWLVKQGTVDPRRVCIIGASYGGYAALWGAHRNPDRYRCAASYAGISDLGKQLKYQTGFLSSRRYRKDWRRIVQGSPNFDTRTVSPIASVDTLKVPLLIMHGDADQTVPYKQSKLYADALKKAGKTYEFYTHAKEGHGFSSSTNLQDWLDRLDTFLTKYNPS